jgi:hypothetical protein
METRSYEYPLEERVFHIDEECYVVYLGSGPDDYKPFLRIGNSRHLGDSAISNINTIVITDSLTGDPLFEPKNLNRKELKDNRYVGSEETVDRMFRLLKQLNVKTDKIPSHREFHTEDERAILTMFDNGNLTLTYDNKPVFDLKKREKNDLHFVERSKWLRDQLFKNHTRYPADVFTNPGFLTLGKALFLFSAQAFIAFELPEDFFTALVNAGIDPDLVTSVVAEEPTNDFVKLCKRKQFKGEHLALLAGKGSVFQVVLDLFESRTRESLKYTIEDFSGGAGKSLGEWSVAKSGGDFVVVNPRLPWTIRVARKLTAGSKKEFLINPWRGVAAYPAGMSGDGLRVADGIPHVLLFKPPDGKTIVSRYFSELSGVFGVGLAASETNAIEFIGKVFEGLKSDEDVADRVETARKRLGDVKLDTSSPLYFLFHNVKELCRYLSKAPDRSLAGLENAAEKLVEQAGKTESHAPLVADCYFLENGAFALYRLSKSSIKKETVALARELVSEAGKRISSPRPFFASERERLAAHIRSLTAPVSRKKPQEDAGIKVPPQKTAPSGAAGAETVASAGRPGTRPKKERHVLRNALIVIGALAILAAALLVPPVSLLDRSLKMMGLREEESAAAGTTGAGEAAGIAQGGAGAQAPGTGGAVESGEAGAGAQAPGTGGVAEIQIPEADKERIQTLISGSPVEITVLDIYNLVNIVATASGFRRLDEAPNNRRDPNWIFPGDALALPEGKGHSVVKGDTIWWVSARFIKAQLNRDWKTYQSIAASLEKTAADAKTEDAVEKLTALKKGSYCARFRKEIDKKIHELSAK